MLSILLFKELLWFGMDISLYKNTSTFLGLSRDKTKGQPGKNTSLTLTKTLPTKHDHSHDGFQIVLSTYKKNILKVKQTQVSL